MNIELPTFVDKNQLKFDWDFIKFLCKLGGISDISIKSFVKDTEIIFETEMGLDNKGTAIASKTQDKINSTYNYKLRAPFELTFPMHAYDWAKLEINIDINEILRKILHEEKQWKKGISDPEAWAYYLDQSIKDALGEAIYKYLVTEVTIGETIYGIGPLLAMTARALYDELAKGSSPETTLGQVFLTMFIISLMENFHNFMRTLYRNYITETDRNFRLSLIFPIGPQIDRVLLTRLLMVLKPIVQANNEA